MKHVLQDSADEEVAGILAGRVTPAKLESVLMDDGVQEELDKLISKEGENDFQEAGVSRQPRQPEWQLPRHRFLGRSLPHNLLQAPLDLPIQTACR